jgi:hypothetical protein
MILDSYDCELCLFQIEEKLRHLFFSCPIAKNCWNIVGINVPTWLNADRATKHIRRQLNLPFAMDIVMLMWWGIWTERNAWIFNNEAPPVQKCKATIKREFDLVIQRAKKKFSTPDGRMDDNCIIVPASFFRLFFCWFSLVFVLFFFFCTSFIPKINKKSVSRGDPSYSIK